MATTRTWVTDERWGVVVTRRDASSCVARHRYNRRRTRRFNKGVVEVAAAKHTKEEALTVSDDDDDDGASSSSSSSTATKTWKTWFLSTIESGNVEAMGVVMTMRTASCKAVVDCMRFASEEAAFERCAECLIRIADREMGDDDDDDDDDDDGDRGINAVDSLRGMSAVCWAAKFGRADALSTLTQSGCRPTARAAMCAIQGASQALTATQLSKSSTTNGAWVDDEAVIEATTDRYLDTARAVLEAYVRDFSCGGGDASSILDVISTDARGWTPLTFAARKPRLGVPFVALLLDFGADPNLSDAHGRSPLVHAALAGDADVARVLIHRGADINFRDVDGFTPAMHAAFRHPASVDLSLALSSASDD
jgi:hypothetical protein